MMNRATKFAVGTTAVLVIVMLVGMLLSFGYGRSINFTDIAQDRTILIDGIRSYWNLQELENHLRKNSIVWELEQGQRPSPNDKRPPFIVDTVRIKNYSHLGMSGEMRVMLFNNRVVSTMFFPREVDKYIAHLAKIEGVDLVKNQEINLSRYTRIWRAEADRGNRRYVGWEDVRLSDEIRIWIRRYS